MLLDLKDRIIARDIRLAVIGLGYVGLPLAIEFARAGFPVTGIDVSLHKIDLLRSGTSDVGDVPNRDLVGFMRQGRLAVTTDYAALSETDVVIICVPTPLSKTKDPDMSFIISAVDSISEYLHPGQLIILESTTYPGTTDELIQPKLEANGLKAGIDFSLAFSPERIDPGNKQYTVRTIPKIVGGITSTCRDITTTLYQQIVDRVIPVSTTRTAEMAKLLENTFRSVNIGLVNEIALICDKLGIDVWETIEAAATKPFGFIPFYPGPGLGGHCIPIDPHYLSWKLKMLDYSARFITLASEVNSNMPYYVVSKITDTLNQAEKSVKGSKVLILGVAYKADINDLRESPALDILEILDLKGAIVAYHDPYIPLVSLDGKKLRPIDLTAESLRQFDCVAIVTAHSGYDYQFIVDHSRAVVDTRNATKGITSGREKIVKL